MNIVKFFDQIAMSLQAFNALNETYFMPTGKGDLLDFILVVEHLMP